MVDCDAFEILNPDATSSVIVLCDHASRFIPPNIGGKDLGLALADLERHIAYDVGALDVAKYIAEHYHATLVFSRFSRLVIDANRGEDDPTLVMRLYDGTIIPGNRQVNADEVEQRLRRFHRPYHGAIRQVIDEKLVICPMPILLSIHSFTPQLRGGGKRPWHIGVLWEGDDTLALPVIQSLRLLSDVCVGDNKPYSGGLPGDTLNIHGSKRGLPHVLVEFRSDLIEDGAGQCVWAEKIIAALNAAIATLGKEKT